MSDDLDAELDEFEDNEDDGQDAGGRNPLRGVVKKLERKIQRIEKDHEKALTEAKTQAIEEYQVGQKKVAQAKEVFGGLGYEGFAPDFLALHPDTAEVAPDAAKEWLTARGLEVKGDDQQQAPVQEAPAPPPAAKFHQAGSSGAPSTSRYSPEEFRALVLKNPDEAKRVIREGLVDYDAKPAQSAS